MAGRAKRVASAAQLLLRSPRAARQHPAAASIAAWSSIEDPSLTNLVTPWMVTRRNCGPQLLAVTLPQSQAARGMSCCAGLGSAPPREIVVEYSCNGTTDDYTDEFIELANAIEEKFPEFVVAGNPDELQPREGAFEITAGDSIIFSKLKMERLPDVHEIIRSILSLPPTQCTVS